MNEELQSTNEELETMNDELRAAHASSSTSVNAFLETILTQPSGVAVVVLDRDSCRCRSGTARREELWGLAPEEVEGQHFLGLDIGLPVEQLKGALREALADGAEAHDSVSAVTRRGKAVECAVRTIPLRRTDGDVSGAIVLIAVDGDRALGGA